MAGAYNLSVKAVDMWNGLPVLIECFGDSTMVGVDSILGGTTPQPAPDKLAAVLGDYLQGSVTVTNHAVSGSRSTQMILGTDGSGSTFDAKMAISDADIVYCNHGINDCQNATPTTPEQYRQNLVSFVSSCMAYGKIPVLMTPCPIFATGGLGTTDKANRLKNYVQIMRDVAAETDTTLIEIYDLITGYAESGLYRISDLCGDGIHPTVLTYRAMGSEMAVPILHPHKGLIGPNQFVSTVEGTTNIYPPRQALSAPATRTGYHLVSDAIDQAKSLKVVVRVDRPGLDIWMAYPIWVGGLASVNIAWDQVTVGQISQFSTAAFTGGEFVHDQEICIARNVPVGLHILTMASGGGAASLALSYLRTRATRYKKTFKGAAGGSDRWRDKPLQSIIYTGAAAEALEIYDELPVSRFLSADGNIDLTFNATMPKDTQFILHGVYTAAVGAAAPPNARMGIGVGLDASGFVNVYQLTGTGTHSVTALNAVDFSGVARTWRLIVVAGTNNLNVYVGGALQGTVAITKPYIGGFMGARCNGAGKTIQINDLRDIEH